jgi:hypothetical protein
MSGRIKPKIEALKDVTDATVGLFGFDKPIY